MSRFRLQNVQVLLLFQRALHCEMILYLVRLSAQRMHRFALAAVEHAHLQISCVRIDTHLPAQSVYFAYEVPLGGAAYGRITSHISNGVRGEGHHQRAQRSARQSQRRFHARMTSAYNYRIVTLFHNRYYIILTNFTASICGAETTECVKKTLSL